MLRVTFLLLFGFLHAGWGDDAKLPIAKWSADASLVYNYETEIHVTDHLGVPSPTSGVKLLSQVTISRVARLPGGSLLLRVAVDQPRVDQAGQVQALAGPGPSAPAYLVWHQGAVSRLHVADKESAFWTNVFKGVASLIHSRPAAGDHREVDASGECRSTYRMAEDGFSVERTKRRCSPMDLSEEVHGRAEGRGSGRTRVSRTVLRLRSTDGLLESAAGRDTVVVFFAIAGQLGPAAMALESSQELRLLRVDVRQGSAPEDEEEEKAMERLEAGRVFRATTMASAAEVRAAVTEKQLRKLLEQHRGPLGADDTATVGAVEAFRAVVAAVRGVRDSRTLSRVLDDEDFADMSVALSDAVVTCATGPCVSAILRRLRLNETERREEQERLLLGLSHVAEPDEATLLHLLSQARLLPALDEKEEVGGLQAQLWATLGSLVGRHRLSPTGKYAKVTVDTVAFLQALLNDGVAQEETLFAAMVALQNVGEAPDAVPVLLNLLTSANMSHRVHCAAMDTLIVVGVPDKLRGLARSRALRLVQSRPFQVDVTARVRALDFLLSLHPTVSQLVAAARSFRAEPHLREAFVGRARAWSVKEGRDDAWDLVLERVPDLLSYPGPAGQAPLRQQSVFLAGNATRGEVRGVSEVDLITGADGSVRRSDSHAVLLLPDHSRLPLYRLALYADGLGSMTGTEADAAVDVTAGVGLHLLGVGMRPIKFFSGYSSLMGAVWNAPTSLTPFLQLNVAFVDVQHVIYLQNGLSIRFSASGLASIDLSGMFSISLWTQKAETQLRTTAAIGLSVSAELTSSRLSAHIAKNASASFAMHFDSNADFSNLPPKACLLASFPDTAISWTIKRRFGSAKQSVLGSRVVPGATLSLGRSNERSCNDLLEK